MSYGNPNQISPGYIPGVGNSWPTPMGTPLDALYRLGSVGTLGSLGYRPSAAGQAFNVSSGGGAAPSQQPAQTQTPSQAQSSEQPAPRQPATQPSSTSGSYGYGPQSSYAYTPQAPVAGAAPTGPAYAPPPQALAPGIAPIAPTLVRGTPAPAQAPAQIQAPAFMPRQTIMSMPPVNPLHAAIQGQMAGAGGSFQSPFFAEATNRRYQGYQQ